MEGVVLILHTRLRHHIRLIVEIFSNLRNASLRGDSQIENAVLNVDLAFGGRGYIVGTSRFHV